MLTTAVLAGLAVLFWPTDPRRPWAAGTLPPGHPSSSGPPRPNTRLSTHRVLQRLRRGPRTGADDWVADFAEVVCVGLEAGLDLPSAALASARSPTVASRVPWLAGTLEASAAEGGGVAEALGRSAEASEADVRELSVLITAWRLSEEGGVSAAEVTMAAADAVRSRRAGQERCAAVVAGPRASMWLLTGLPLAGPVAAVLVGVGPASLYGSPATALSAVVGAVLTGTGWWWCRLLLRRAVRPGRTTSP